jgi:hypothetical protein
VPDGDLMKTSQGFSAVAGNKEKAVRIYGGQYTNSGSCGTTRGAGDGIKSRTPAEMLGWGPRPGVERSETPGARRQKYPKPAERPSA